MTVDLDPTDEAEQQLTEFGLPAHAAVTLARQWIGALAAVNAQFSGIAAATKLAIYHDRIQGRKSLSTEEAARALGLTEGIVGRLLRAGTLRGVKANSVWIVPLDALDEFLAPKPDDPTEEDEALVGLAVGEEDDE
jgi:excisionase family DNA binding protein